MSPDQANLTRSERTSAEVNALDKAEQRLKEVIPKPSALQLAGDPPI
jgi:hypothetical protein